MNSPWVDDEPSVLTSVDRRRALGNGPFDECIENGPQQGADLYVLQIERHENGSPINSDNPSPNTPNTTVDVVVDCDDDDDDDQQGPSSLTNHVFEYLRYYQQDLFWSYLSDTCFLMGSLLYLSLSYYEVTMQGPAATKATPPSYFYNVLLNIFAPVLYLLNSVVDIHWAVLVQRRPRRPRTEDDLAAAGLWRTNTGLPPPLMLSFSASNDFQPESDQQHQHHRHATASMPVSLTSTVSCSWWQRLFRYAAHRRTMYAAGSFGLAALLSVVAVSLEYKQQTKNVSDVADDENSKGGVVAILYTASDHVYVLSAVFALTGRRVRPWFYTGDNNDCCCWRIFVEPEALEDMGDVLFLIGSLFDAIMLDNLDLKTIPILGAVSSLLWFVDALLYLQSDFVMSRRLRISDLTTQLV